MRRFHIRNVVLLVLFFLFAVALASAVTPNPGLISLVPPAARMVAGVTAPQHSGWPSSLLLITHRNLVDLNDFMALSGVDGHRVIEQVIMIASDNGKAVFAEHSLLASGSFDHELIYRSAYKSAAANAIQYRGIPILEILPLARERENIHDKRWLTIIDSKLALFGSIAMVRQELDRYLAHSAADASLEWRLARLRRNDDSWCTATLPDNNDEIQAIFKLLDSRLVELLRAGDTVQFGVHYGRRVEFEYEVGMVTSPGPETASRTLMQPLASPQANERVAFPTAEWSRSDGGAHGVLKISRDRYEAWRAEVMAAQTDQRVATISSNN